MTLRRNILALLGIAISIGGLLVTLAGLEHWIARAPGLGPNQFPQLTVPQAIALIALGGVVVLAGLACLYLAFFRSTPGGNAPPDTRSTRSPDLPTL